MVFATHWHESAMGVHVSLPWTPLPPPSPSHPSGLPQCTSFECPVWCIELGLVICFTYGNIHVSMLFSQIIPPSPSPTESRSLLFISVSLLLSHIVTIFLNSIYICVNILYWCFNFWLTSLCIIGSSFIHLIKIDSNCILFYSWVIFHCVYVPQLSYPFICRWTSRSLPCPGCCKQLRWTLAYMCLSVLVSSVCMPSSGIAGFY